MALSTAASADAVDLPRTRGARIDSTGGPRSLDSAVSWAAILAGAAGAAALSLILLMLGVGLGLSSVSPWSTAGVGAATFGVSTILWLALTQLLASAMGGYLAGRLRTKWTEVPADEVYFRDTAHGFLTWAVASLATAALLSSVIGSILSGGVQAGASVVGRAGGIAGAMAATTGPAQGMTDETMGYFVDALFRRDVAPAATAVGTTGSPAVTQAAERVAVQDTSEVGRIFLNAGRSGMLPAEDIRQVGQIVAERTGLTQPEAERRVSSVHAKFQARRHDMDSATRQAADTARKASAYGALWLFVSLLIGAFIASLAATLGGRGRDA